MTQKLAVLGGLLRLDIWIIEFEGETSGQSIEAAAAQPCGQAGP